ncbi:carboxypeptidase Taq Metallo peptidase. MEROPS family M32 [Cribrihabitans marinus]|uniref:Metal-dependent carboxypeptidase n=1 Tax=Cribrihabitans marinus TaxID=1227549 RepID=A0A1H6VU59_9RHOB|nr:carboxypeptidase M32 [Cribrihabitans marinus]GGH25136.1 carboxypeptidase Taq [Cribrihabitans marinus]SEJ08173.1 carboxypeptidase Taq Metallo peptidase. MEROPS family M32 [Cribrihabitans marinus]
MTAFDDLMAFQRETSALGQIAGRLGWDQETVMPRGAAAQRSEEMAAIEGVLHARRSDPRVGEWLAAAEPPDEAGAAQLREIRRAFERAQKVPGALAAQIARTTSRAQGLWAQARADEDVAAFLPVLEEVVALKREEGAALAAGGSVYDALVEDYEPHTTGDDIAAIFDAMRPRLVALRAAVLDRPQPAGLTGTYDEGAQMKLSRKIAKVFGYDMTRGRVDKAVHPFSSGSGADVRITTRTNPSDPFNCLYSTIHEVGHAAYEQGVDAGFALSALGQGVSMGVHESQSRIYENQLGRSRAFTGWLLGEMRAAFGDIGIADPDAFYAAVNRVHNGYIRTEADELQYNLHIMLRFDLERALMAGDLQVADLETAWNDRFATDFGYPVDKPSNGLLQDVHWSVGLFGYFPTYALGNVYAGCLHEALRKAVPDLDAQLAQGDTSAATRWLRDVVQRHGSLYLPREVIERASGQVPSEGPILNYLEAKFGALYGL